MTATGNDANAPPRDPAHAGRTSPVRRIVLVGFMAAGKSTIAPRLAQALHWRVFDLDAEIVARTGMSIAALFREHGEAHFRALEAELTVALCSGENIVVAPGGGWIANPASAPVMKDPHTRLVWLRVTAQEAVRRAQQDDTGRPLLNRGDALEEAQRLLTERERLYASADVAFDVDGRTADAVLEDILEWLRPNIS